MSAIDGIEFDTSSDAVRESLWTAAMDRVSEKSPPALGQHSTIAPVEKRELNTFQSRPKLAPPRHFILGFADSLKESESNARKYAKVFETEVARDRAEITRLNEEKLEKIRLHSKAAEVENSWSAWASLARVFQSGSTIALGVAVIGSSPVAGGLLLLSGGITTVQYIAEITRSAPAETVASWLSDSSERQALIVEKLRLAGSWMPVGLGIAGAGIAYATGGLSLVGRSMVPPLIASIQTISSVAYSILQLGRSFENKNMLLLQADIHEMNAEISALYERIDTSGREAQSVIESITDQTGSLKEIIDMVGISFD